MLVFPMGGKIWTRFCVELLRWYSFGNGLLEGNIRSSEQGFGHKSHQKILKKYKIVKFCAKHPHLDP